MSKHTGSAVERLWRIGEWLAVFGTMVGGLWWAKRRWETGCAEPIAACR